MTDTTPNIDIIRTKLHRPTVTKDLVPRTTLLEQLEYRRQHPLTVISAPAGYSKSTLASSWLEASECPGAWVSLDEDDNDLRLFLTYVVAALQTLFPQAGQHTQALLSAAELPLHSRRFLRSFRDLRPSFMTTAQRHVCRESLTFSRDITSCGSRGRVGAA
jgi:LuxR family maltose regulon positive regulatory protein